ncbi:putative F-box protein At1g49610 [Nicotiana tabacum]|uniref:F-box protein At1g49610 n=2 Tax=Nicotiana TaxID=4085 RepID=A0A1S3YBE0_TOBAC|nr:PREDICTED: putative F-box protein At1g49610 [Nicotiana sylvestris]XP_016449571.1 PREDICTED: putative F-box protein At1g49610 [Nicotiana tabacum]
MGVASDRFSSLPDSVLLHILSFLPFDDVVRTTLLCKQWRPLWSFSTSLNFIHRPKDFISLKKFASFVDKSLINLHCNNSSISKLHLDFPFKRCFSSDVTVWVLFAITHKVKELNLILSSDAEDLYKLPKRLFSNPFIEKVNWVGCKFDKVEVFRWDSLRELRIGSIEFCDDMVRKVVFGSPCLELLELDNCWGFKRLDLVGGKVSKLVVNGYNGEAVKKNSMLLDFEVVEIEAPCVKVLELKGCFRRMNNIQLKNVMSCVSVKLDFQFTKDEERVNYVDMLMGMIGSLRHVKDVMLGTWCIEVMSSWPMNILPFSMSSYECLTLHTPIQERYLPGIVRILQSSSNLRTLIIHMAPPYFEFEACFIPIVYDVYSVGGRCQLSMLSKNCGLHLKKIRICCFEGMRSGQEVLFLRDLLLVCANLEEMVIEWRSGHQNSSIRDASDEFVAESLLMVQKRSRNAVILFNN